MSRFVPADRDTAYLLPPSVDEWVAVGTAVTQACNDKREVVPTLQRIAALPTELGEVNTLIADNGFFSQANLSACHEASPASIESISARQDRGMALT